MKLIQGGQFKPLSGKQQSKLIGKQGRIERLVANSDLFLMASPSDSETPECLYMEIRGDLAVIPNLKASYRAKNSRLFVASEFIETMQALDQLWKVARKDDPPIFYGDTHLHVEIIQAEQCKADPINTAQTICDWLEPRVKPNKKGDPIDRGWGIGITANDRHVTPHSLWPWQVPGARDFTLIVVRPWESIRESAIRFHAEHMLDRGPNENAS